MKKYSFITENNQTITSGKHTAREFGSKYWKSGKKLEDSNLGIYHIYRTIKSEDGSTKVKRIKKQIKDK